MKTEYPRKENIPPKETLQEEKVSKPHKIIILSQEQQGSAWPEDLGSRLVFGNCVFVSILDIWL